MFATVFFDYLNSILGLYIGISIFFIHRSRRKFFANYNNQMQTEIERIHDRMVASILKSDTKSLNELNRENIVQIVYGVFYIGTAFILKCSGMLLIMYCIPCISLVVVGRPAFILYFILFPLYVSLNSALFATNYISELLFYIKGGYQILLAVFLFLQYTLHNNDMIVDIVTGFTLSFAIFEGLSAVLSGLKKLAGKTIQIILRKRRSL